MICGTVKEDLVFHMFSGLSLSFSDIHISNFGKTGQLLEATAKAVQPVIELGESGLAVADGLSNLLKCRLPATIRCLSHPSAHVRALSTSVLRDILHTSWIRSSPKPPQKNGIHNQYFNLDVIDWQADIEKCLTWEAHARLSNGLPIEYLNTAAKDLGFAVSI